MRQIRIQSDGDGRTTVITDAEGKTIDYVTSAAIFLEPGELSTVNLDIRSPKVDAHADLSETALVCPICSHRSTHYCGSL